MSTEPSDNVSPERAPADLVTVFEAATAVERHPNTIRRWALLGLIKKWIVGHSAVRYSLAEVQQFAGPKPEPSE